MASLSLPIPYGKGETVSGYRGKSRSSGTKEYVAKKISGRSVVDAEGSDFGEYYLVNAQGDLELWGESGNFYKAKATH